MPVLQEQKPVNMNNYSSQSIEKSDSKWFSLDNCVLHRLKAPTVGALLPYILYISLRLPKSDGLLGYLVQT